MERTSFTFRAARTQAALFALASAASLSQNTLAQGSAEPIAPPRGVPTGPVLPQGTAPAPLAERPAWVAPPVVNGEVQAQASTPFDRERTKRVLPASTRTAVEFQKADDGSLWARGRTFKASFGAGGATYIPFFGADAPQNFPVSVSLGSATIGGAPVALTPATSASRDGQRFTIDRGVIDEVYDVALESVEQSFVIEERPGEGDLELFVPLTSELALGETADGIALQGELGSVRYGRAFALGADGARIALGTSVVEGGVSIHVGSELLASAHYPLVVDPLLTTFTVDNNAPTQWESDIAYDLTNDRYLIVWEEPFSATDGDVYFQLRGSDGTVHNAGWVDFTSQNWRGPQTANLNSADQFLIVAQVSGISGLTGTVVWGVPVPAATGTLGFGFLISTTEQFGDKFMPDVGGDPYGTGPTYYCVVWQRNYLGERDIHYRLVRSDSTLVGTGTQLIDNTIGAIDAWPAISKSNGQIGSWVIAWHRGTPGDTILAARVSWGGSITNPPTVIGTGGLGGYYPRVSSPRGDGRVCVVYARNYVTDHDILYATLSGVTVEASGSLSALDPLTWGQDQVEYSIDSDGERFLMAFCENKIGSNGDYDVLASSLVLQTTTSLRVAESRVPLDIQSGLSARTDTVSRVSGGITSSRVFRIVWDTSDATGDPDIQGADFERRLGGGWSFACPGDNSGSACPCGNYGSSRNGCANSVNASGARLVGAGNAQTGAGDTFQIYFQGAPAGSPALLFQGTTGGWYGSGFGDGVLCTGGTIVRFSVKFTDGTGSAYWPTGADPAISVSGAVPLAGDDFFYQAYYRDAGSFCTSSTFNVSNGVQALWLP